MNTKKDTIDYEANIRNARQQRADEIARIYGNIVAFFRNDPRTKIEKAFRPVASGKHGASLWPSV